MRLANPSLPASVSSFNSRTPCGVRHYFTSELIEAQKFQFTHPVRGATFIKSVDAVVDIVSIHAPRAGCDNKELYYAKVEDDVSIHAPRAGCDHRLHGHGRDLASVSIHAPRAGCDILMPLDSICDRMFQFTHPVRGATAIGIRSQMHYNGFNSRTPCGVRQLRSRMELEGIKFQFTHPVRGATSRPTASKSCAAGFNSRTPCGVRPRIGALSLGSSCFNSRTPCGVRPSSAQPG